MTTILLSKLRSLRALLGTDAPEVRGWAPAVQQQAQRTVNEAIQALSAQQAPSNPKKLLGWRTENYLWETANISLARNWEPHIGVLPIFEGDTNTQLGATGDAS